MKSFCYEPGTWRMFSRLLGAAEKNDADVVVCGCREFVEKDGVVEENIPYFGYGYIKDVNQLVPNVPLNFYAFRIMAVSYTHLDVYKRQVHRSRIVVVTGNKLSR